MLATSLLSRKLLKACKPSTKAWPLACRSTCFKSTSLALGKSSEKSQGMPLQMSSLPNSSASSVSVSNKNAYVFEPYAFFWFICLALASPTFDRLGRSRRDRQHLEAESQSATRSRFVRMGNCPQNEGQNLR